MPAAKQYYYLEEISLFLQLIMISLDKDIWDWIESNIKVSPDRLRLSNHGDDLKMFAITQIDCRQRTAKKLSETLAAFPKFIFDSTIAAQQSTSDSLAKFHSSLIGANASVLDMTGGLGIDALHCSRVASNVVMVEKDAFRAECAAYNFQNMGVENVEVKCGDSVDFLNVMPDNEYDYIFIDPARRGVNGERLYALSQCKPDVTMILGEMLRVAPNVIIKASPMLDACQVLKELHPVSRIIALGTKAECKELIIICRREPVNHVEYSAVTIMPSGDVEFNFHDDATSDIVLMADRPEVGDILYEPYPAIVKMKPFGAICNRYNVSKPALDTHLFFKKTIDESFPGVPHEILEVTELNKRSIKDLSARYTEADVTVKNFPMTSTELAARLKVRPSGEIRLFAFRTANGTKLIVIARRLQPSGAV